MMAIDGEALAPQLPRIEPPKGSGWQLHSPYGAQRFKDGPDGRLVRLADVVRWLTQDRETSFANAVRAVCAPLEGDAPPLLYRLDPVEDAAPESDASPWLKFLTGYDDLHTLPPRLANARAAARDVKAAWLMMPRELSRLVNDPSYPAQYDETKESPFEFSERPDRTGGPKDLAVPFAVAHALWGWGSVKADENEAPASPFPLANWPALVAYRKANAGSDWGLGDQVAVGKTELLRRVEEGKTKSAALEEMAREVGLGSRQAMSGVLKRERSRVKNRAREATPLVTMVRDGKRQPKAA